MLDNFMQDDWFYIPCQPQSKEPYFKYAPKAINSSKQGLEHVIKWLEEGLNVGIHCQKSNLVVFDVDFRNGGSPDSLPETLTVKTGDGYHYYYYASPDQSFSGKHSQGIDIKHKGYVVAPPSIHPSGVAYELFNDHPITVWNPDYAR